MNKQEYAAYLKSPHWKALRAQKRKQADKRCAICADTNQLHTHHLTYRNIYDVKTSDLRLLCERCHSLAHDLIKRKVLVINPLASHNTMFTVTKVAVKKALGLTGVNMFNKQARNQCTDNERECNRKGPALETTLSSV